MRKDFECQLNIDHKMLRINCVYSGLESCLFVEEQSLMLLTAHRRPVQGISHGRRDDPAVYLPEIWMSEPTGAVVAALSSALHRSLRQRRQIRKFRLISGLHVRFQAPLLKFGGECFPQERRLIGKIQLLAAEALADPGEGAPCSLRMDMPPYLKAR